jgi:type I restriction enzyme S subunit
MSTTWRPTRLGEVLRRSDEAIDPSNATEYRQITVRLWGKGVVERGRADGASLSGRRFVAREGQFIASRIDARNGAMGLVPASLDGALVTNDFPLFDADEQRLLPGFLGWLCRTPGFVELCSHASEGTTNRVRLKEDRFLALEVLLPPLAEQQRIVARIERLAALIGEARALRHEAEDEMQAMLQAAFDRIIAGAPRYPMREIAPIVRRPIKLEQSGSYPELGIRSFGKGTFPKPALSALEVGTKRIFRIEPGDLLFSNVFAWEGAIAIAKPEDAGRVGSHRFITCVPQPDQATAEFLRFFFLTDEGLGLIGTASPGGAGRNRTLGLGALQSIPVPVPAIERQRWFDALQASSDECAQLRHKAAAESNALLPSILDRALCGELQRAGTAT